MSSTGAKVLLGTELLCDQAGIASIYLTRSLSRAISTRLSVARGLLGKHGILGVVESDRNAAESDSDLTVSWFRPH